MTTPVAIFLGFMFGILLSSVVVFYVTWRYTGETFDKGYDLGRKHQKESDDLAKGA